MSRLREKEPFTVYRGRGGIRTKTFDVTGRPLDEVPVDNEGKVDISGILQEIDSAQQKRDYFGGSPFNRHRRR